MVSEAPQGNRRTATSAFIAAFALAAIAVPMRYYLKNDIYDERFSWRMFSAIHKRDCMVLYVQQKGGVERPVKLYGLLEPTWIKLMLHSREAVMWRFLENRCRQEGVERGRMFSRCTRPTGDALPMMERTYDCRTGEERAFESSQKIIDPEAPSP